MTFNYEKKKKKEQQQFFNLSILRNAKQADETNLSIKYNLTDSGLQLNTIQLTLPADSSNISALLLEKKEPLLYVVKPTD